MTLPPLTRRDGSRLDVECICACDMPSALIPHLKCHLQEKSRLWSEASALLCYHHQLLAPRHCPRSRALVPVGGNANRCGHCGEENEVLHKAENRATLCLGTHPKELKSGSQRDSGTPTALFIQTQVWKHSQSLSTDKRRKKV